MKEKPQKGVLVLPSTREALLPFPGWQGALCGREPAGQGPHLRGRTGSELPTVWAGSRLGRAGPPGQHPAPLRACQGCGEGAGKGRKGSSPCSLHHLPPCFPSSASSGCSVLPTICHGQGKLCGDGDRAAEHSHDPQGFVCSQGHWDNGVTAPKLALESRSCLGFFRRKRAPAAETACAEVPKGTAISLCFSFSYSSFLMPSACVSPQSFTVQAQTALEL